MWTEEVENLNDILVLSETELHGAAQLKLEAVDLIESIVKALDQAGLSVCDCVAQCELIGELRTAREAGYLTDFTPPELDQIVAGGSEGRRSDSDTTVRDFTGTGAQDTGFASYALQIARCARAGLSVGR